MKNEEYLSEERYQQNNIKVKKTGKRLLIIGIVILVIGCILDIIGFINMSSSVVNVFDSMENDNDVINDVINNFDSLDANTVFDSNTIDADVSGVKNTASGMFGNFGLVALAMLMSFIGFSLTGIGGIIMFIAHRREITAYATQQVMPIKQESIEKISPVIGKAAGEIAKGIKQGLNEADKEAKNKSENN